MILLLIQPGSGPRRMTRRDPETQAQLLTCSSCAVRKLTSCFRLPHSLGLRKPRPHQPIVWPRSQDGRRRQPIGAPRRAPPDCRPRPQALGCRAAWPCCLGLLSVGRARAGTGHFGSPPGRGLVGAHKVPEPGRGWPECHGQSISVLPSHTSRTLLLGVSPWSPDLSFAGGNLPNGSNVAPRSSLDSGIWLRSLETTELLVRGIQAAGELAPARA